ncbi:MAG: immunoglobulin domain-containing protein [Bacteroidota bacterium]
MRLHLLAPLRFVCMLLCASGFLAAHNVSAQTSVLNNPGFESGTTGWTFFTNGIGSYAASSPGFLGSNAARLTITTTGNNMQLYQSGFTLKANTSYTLSFAAYSSTGNNLALSLQKHTTPFTNFGINNSLVDIGTGWSTHTVVFTTSGFSGTTTDARLRFVLNSYAAAGNIYFIDNVLLYETPAGSPATITADPTNQVVASGATATFNVTASGTAPLAYKWQRNGIDIVGATNASHTTPATVQADSGATYRCIVSNSLGADTSASAVLSVLVFPPSITQDPQNQSVEIGQAANFSITATGTQPLTFQWQRNGVDIPGATNASYGITTTILADSGAIFRCIASNSFGADTSGDALLQVTYSPPSVTQDPQNQSVEVGQPANFSVTAIGTQPLAYQWQSNGVDISGATSAAYSIAATVLADSGAILRCIVSNSFGADTSNEASLLVGYFPPAVTQHPQNQTVEVGQPAAFNITATGTQLLSYQWQKDGTDISSATNSSYSIPTTVVPDSGSLFRCIVTNLYGVDTSDAALLQVTYLVPSVTQHPQNQTVPVGQAAAFSVTATGTLPLSYQWQKNGTDISGATNASYSIPTTVVPDSGSLFRCIVTNLYGVDTSDAALLQVTYLIPSVTQHPQNQTVELGQTAAFTTTATGTLPLNYQWQKNGVDISGATNPSYTTPATVLADSGSLFSCIVSNIYGADTSSGALLQVTYLPPNVTQHPQNQTVPIGQTASFTVTASGTPPLSYQWQKNGANISGATNSGYTTPATILADSGSLFRCIVTGPLGIDTSDGALLHLTYVLVNITQHPQNQSRTTGQTASFSVTATGTIPLTYQWQRNGADISGATLSSYTTPPTSLPDNGATFRCIASNVGGSDTSNDAVLTVSSAPLPPNLITNPSFESGTTGWTFFTNGTGSAAAVPPGTDGSNAARLTITTTGNNIQFYQSGMSMKANTSYTVSFSAYSSNANDMAVTLQKHTTPFTTFGLNNVLFDLGSSWNTHTVTFTTSGFSGTSTDTRFRFVVNSYAAAGALYFIDNVMLYETPTSGDPPFIIGDVPNQTVASGTTASFSVNAVGTLPLSYQWRKNGANIAGAVNASYTTPVTTVADNGSTYACIVSNAFGADTSNAALLTVLVLPPTVTQHPQNQVVAVGQTATFAMAASGTPPFTYQWQRNGANVGGATSASYTTPATVLADSGSIFRCIVTNSAGVDTTDNAMLSATYLPPTVTQNPQNKSVNVPQTANFTVTASGSPTLSYQWQVNGANIGGATSASYTTPATSIGNNGSLYRCIVSNSAGSDTSSNALLSVTDVPPPMTSLSPRPGNIYKEFTRVMTTSGSKEWRVIDQASTHSKAQQYKPNSIMSFTINDTVGITSAQVLIDQWGGHIGTTNKQFRMNGNAWIAIPELGATNGIPVGANGQCYLQQPNPMISIPVNHLKQGTNTIEGNSGGQTCYGFGWGHWGWYATTVRVYYGASKPHPTGTITSPTNGASFGENPTIAVSASGGAGISKVEVLAYYDGYDTDGDGIYLDYHQSYHRLKTDNSLNVSNIVGTATTPPYQVTWNTDFVPDQLQGSIRLVARIRDNNGVWFVTNEVAGLTLQRDSISVKLYKATNVPERFNVRLGRTTATSKFTVPGTPGLANALAARFLLKTWNGTNKGALSGETHYYKVNTWTAPPLGGDDFYSYDILSPPTSALITGVNTFTVFSNATGHGIEVLWPGPAMVVRYRTTPAIPPSIALHPTNQTVLAGQTATFSVDAAGTQPFIYQWQRNSVAIPGANSSTYTIPPAGMSDNGASYRCVVSNNGGTATSNGATLTVQPLQVQFVHHPASQTVQTGKKAAFVVGVTGTEPITYQWYRNDVLIAGATSAWYVTPTLVLADNGSQFKCIAANAAGPLTSNTGILGVISTVPISSIVSDDFNASSFNSNVWNFINPGTPSTLTMVGSGTTDALLSMNIPTGDAHDMWTSGAFSPRILQPANNTDFEIQLKFQANMAAQYQGSGVIVEQDLTNYIRFNFQQRTTGTRVYAATITNGTATTRYDLSISNGNPIYMRVTRVGNTWTHRYSYNGSTWTTAGTFSFTLTVGRVGPFILNAGSPAPQFTGLVDYFFNNASPIAPEDGSFVAASITTHPSNRSVVVGDSVLLSVAAVGSLPLTYQWQQNGANIPGATSAAYLNPKIKQSDSGDLFRCIATNSGGSDTSDAAMITVLPHPSGIESDDFNTFGLPPTQWGVVNPLNTLIALTGTNTSNAYLTFTLPAGVAHDVWSDNNFAPRILQSANDVDFEVEAKFESNLAANSQMQGIIIQQDALNFIRFDFTRKPSSTNIYAASFLNGVPTIRHDVNVTISNPSYLRVRRQGNQWTQFYSNDGTNWTTAASFSHTLSVNAVGPFAGNVGTTPPAFTANVDYFFLVADPVEPEDGGTAVDTFPPEILQVSNVPGAASFLVNWVTNEPTDGVIQYGLTTGYELGNAQHADLRTIHTLQATGLQNSTLYHFRIIAMDGVGNADTSADFTLTTSIPTPPVIDVWYGNEQTFGHNGNPQPYINILGNVADPHGIASLKYTLNGGPEVNLTVGSDSRRLTKKGDFNVDILYSTLLPQPQTNQVVIIAADSQFTVKRETVTVNYIPSVSWSKTYQIDWSTAPSIQSVAQVVDGKWTINNGNLRVVEPGYDRLVAIGEQTWNDYEISAPITIHSVDTAGFKAPSNGAGIGFLMRWPGHSDLPASTAGMQPKTGFLPLGSLSWYDWDNDFSQRLRIYGNNLVVMNQDNSGRTLSLGIRYIFKARVQTLPGVGGQYQIKIWQDGTAEPAGWDLYGIQSFNHPQTGCILLVAHHLDVSIGNVTVVPLDVLSTIVSDDFFADTLNTNLWTLVNPLSDGSYQMSGSGTLDARVALKVPPGIKHEPWSPSNTAIQLLQPANNVNFEVEAKFDSPFNGLVQMHGIIIKQDSVNFIRFDYSSTGTRTKMFSGTVTNGTTFTPRYNVDYDTLPPYMRVKRIGNQWTQSFSYNGLNWLTGAQFTHAMTVNKVGPYAGNAGAGLPEYTALVDYFFNREFPILDEDAGSGVVPNITAHPINSTVEAGDTVSMAITVIGTPPMVIQWQRNGANIPGATSALYSLITTTVAADSGAVFRCIVTNEFGADTSLSATLTVVHPASIIISDDFHTGSLNTGLWRFVNPRNDASLSFSGVGTQNARVSINVPSSNTHDSWTGGNFAPRIMQDANNTNFEIEAKFESGVTGVHQLEGIIIQQNTSNYMRFDFVTHATSNIIRAFSATMVNNTPTTRINLNLNSIPKGTAPLWLRVKRQGDLWTMSYSTNGSTFTSAGSYSYPIMVDSVGVYAGNAGSTPPAFTCIVDYFFNQATPVVPEDGIPPSITTHPTDKSVIEGQRAMFSVVAAGSPPLTYQWKKNGVNITGATSSTYTTLPTVLADSGATFAVVVSNPFGNVPSTSAKLHVITAVPLPWWNAKWAFRVPLRIHAAGYQRVNKPIESAMNFTGALATLGHFASTFDVNSMRVIEVDSTHAIIDTLVPTQFDFDPTYNATTNASGTMVLLMEGVTGANSTRYFDVYFDTTGGGSFTPPSFPAQVSVFDTASYEGQESFRIVTSSGTYYYHKVGGGFASMFDNNGNDWIGYHPAPPGGIPVGAFNDFRGIPNAGDVFHPGYPSSSSSLASQGPLKLRIRTTSNNGLWEALWDIFPGYARMTMVKMGANYWFLYEGTPGGQLDVNGDFVYRSTGVRNVMSSPWSTDLASPEWAYFGDPSMQRVLYTVHHEDDNKNDYFRQQDGGMTVFGFGRKDPCCIRYIDVVPQTFTIGFSEDSTFTGASTVINSAYRDVNVVVDDPQYVGSSGIPILSTIVSDNFNAVNLNTDLWTYYNPLGDASLSMTGSALSINVPPGVVHDAWISGNNAPRIMQNSNNANFEVEAKFNTTLTLRSQIQGIIVEQDPANYLRFDFVRNTGLTRVFAASLAGSTPTTYVDSTIADGNPLYLKVKRVGNTWTQSFSYNGTTWVNAGTFAHNLVSTKVGPFFGNAGPTPPLFIGTVDYFYNTEVPIVPTKAFGGEEEIAHTEPLVPEEFFLNSNYPNPFNPTTTIQFGIPEAATVSVKVYNMLGQEVATLADGTMDGGYYNTVWDGRNMTGIHVGSGVFIYRMNAVGVSGKTFSNLKKMILLR